MTPCHHKRVWVNSGVMGSWGGGPVACTSICGGGAEVFWGPLWASGVCVHPSIRVCVCVSWGRRDGALAIVATHQQLPRTGLSPAPSRSGTSTPRHAASAPAASARKRDPRERAAPPPRPRRPGVAGWRGGGTMGWRGSWAMGWLGVVGLRSGTQQRTAECGPERMTRMRRACDDAKLTGMRVASGESTLSHFLSFRLRARSLALGPLPPCTEPSSMSL